MTAPLIEPLEDDPFLKGERVLAMFWGATGVGKTVLAAQYPKPFFFDMDDNLVSIKTAAKNGHIDVDYKAINRMRIKRNLRPSKDKSWDQLGEGIDRVLEAEKKGEIPPVSTLIFDSMSVLNFSVLVKGSKEAGAMGVSESYGKAGSGKVIVVTQADYGVALQLMINLLEWLKAETNKNLIFIAHEYYLTTKKGDFIGYRPLLNGQARDRFPALMTDLYRMTMKGKGEKATRTLHTQGTSLFPANSRLGCFDPEEPADYPKLRAKAAKFFEIPEANLWDPNA